MRDAPVTIGGVRSQALSVRLSVVLATVWVLALFVDARLRVLGASVE